VVLSSVVLVSVALLIAPVAAQAHATLLRSDPARGATVATPPRAVHLFFDDTIVAEPGVKAIDNGGSSVLGGRPRVIGERELVIPLDGRLARGSYTVLWRARSDDGHSIAGLVAFAVGPRAAHPRPALALPHEASTLEVIARWLFLAGILIASGAALFTLALRPVPRPPRELFVVGFVLVVAGGPLLAGRASLSTRFGLVVAAATAVAAAGAAATALGGRRRGVSRVSLMMALGLVVAPSLSGHALDAGRPWVELPVDVVHVAASSFWLGGLLALALLLHREPAHAALVRRFSSFAVGAVCILAATGLVRALAELDAVAQVWSTGYGRLLVAKTAILALLVGIGWFNRFRVVPALARSLTTLRRNIAAELALFVGLIAVVAVLTDTRPGRDREVAAAAPAAAARPVEATDAQTIVIGQRRDGLQIAGRIANAVRGDARHLLWESWGSEQGGAAELVERDLAARRSTVLAPAVAPQFGLAVTRRWVVYAAPGLPPRLVAMPRDGGPPAVLSRRLVAAVAQRGERVAWAEQDGARQRVLVRHMARGRTWVAADMPRCVQGRCYRVDAVTLADRGVAFDRGAIGPQPSLVVRRSFSARRSESVVLTGDPQPDLIPSSAGAAYYALGRGWYRWDFGDARPRRTGFGPNAPMQPLRLEGSRWLLQARSGCGSTVLSQGARGRRTVLESPRTVLRRAGAKGDLCATLVSLTGHELAPVTSWALVPVDSHTGEDVTGVIALSRPAR
jgi:copper transport protein